MAKKIVRGITDVKTITNQDFDTNNVNDLLSDGQYNYIHRKKGKTEEYHNLTDNIKTLSSDNTDLLTVTNNNKTTNTATLHPKHDAQKEQVLESTRDTITINHGTNGTDEKTTVDTNPKKVLEHDNLTVTDGLIKEHTGNTTNIRVNPKEVLFHQYLTGGQGIEVFHLEDWFGTEVKISDTFLATVNGKQNAIENNTSIGVSGNGLRQLYTLKQTYSHTNGVLKTHVKSVSSNTSVTTPEEEFNFILKINQGQQSSTFTLNEHDKTKFTNIITTYGEGGSVRINGCLFTLSDTTLTVSNEPNTGSNLVITFSDII